MADKDIESLADKYRKRLREELGEEKPEVKTASREYHKFRREMLPEAMTLYEKACNLSEAIIKLPPDKKEGKEIQKSIDTCHLEITPTGVKSLSVLLPFAIIIVGIILGTVGPIIIGAQIGIFTIAVFVLTALSLYFILSKIPYFLANSWRLKASNEMVLSIFYIVTYMRHTSNLENAIVFASEHLTGPLSIDLRKVVWDIETSKFKNIRESLDDYLDSWKETNPEYVEAMHLIESSLFEPSETRRLDLLDKSLDVILDETYEKMLHYAHNLHSPITMLHMFGVILPILGLVMMPLIANFMTTDIPPDELAIYIAAIYNLILPIIVYYFGKNILATRPTGYGDNNIGEIKRFRKYKNILFKIGSMEFEFSPLVVAVLIGLVGLIITAMPLVMYNANVSDIIIIDGDDGWDIKVSSYTTEEYRQSAFQFIGYKESERSGEGSKSYIGMYGLGASLISLIFPLCLGIAISLYYGARSRKLMKIREDSKKLENQFASSLFQLGNRLADGLPSEIAFSRVAQVLKGSIPGKFFGIVASNISRLGLSVKEAIFDPKIGALVYYPSNLIESSMKVLIESSKKGPRIAAQALMNISRYVKEIHRVNERLNDLMADIISSMKSQISFLTPIIAGIVVGITSMVTYILSKLTYIMEGVGEGTTKTALSGLDKMFGDGIPTYYSQIIIGLYVIQITYLLTTVANSIENGSDKLNEEYMLANNIKRTTLLYVVVSFFIMIIFNYISYQIIQGVMIS